MNTSKSILFRGDNHTDYALSAALFPSFSFILILLPFIQKSNLQSTVITISLGLAGIIIPIYLFLKNRYEIIFFMDEIQIKYTSAPEKNWDSTYQHLKKVQFFEFHKGPPRAYFTFINESGKSKKIKVVIENNKSCIDLVNHCITLNSKVKIEAQPLNGDMFLALKKSLYKRYFFD